eukprot:CAMPEP_0184289506 /NCGR_PEP_ID=MMETSP1049-20130417/1966_1 /TAXON_ID=77928 /ORGANISM="Proteomonas sulcata, Strain CCMP704" /LENGTH=287 /DNA_ID=CAMNT_0026596355 /DNA_START=148 /DNA_END=1011 /DNA_ORIENTATION=-
MRPIGARAHAGVRAFATQLQRSAHATVGRTVRKPVAGFPVTQAVAPFRTGVNQVMAVRFMSAIPSPGEKPSIEYAKDAPRDYEDLPNEVLLVYCAQGDHQAHRERLIRNIMDVDQLDWDSAQPKLDEIEAANKAHMWFFTLPYKVGIFTSVTAGLISFPMVFHLDTALWFNEHYVTTEVAAPEDLETWLEVGSWTWAWNEPVMGQLSFFLLALQFARNQMVNQKFRPYTERLLEYRANRLCTQFPQYSEMILSDFARSDEFSGGAPKLGRKSEAENKSNSAAAGGAV